ncbi:unnamed protein product [marine sediment metagenome]|uniref:Uncharacterized protein n=2 Tax=marine sediment metagenome TaxID=412755 RepID=X0YU02_9ZZZZ
MPYDSEGRFYTTRIGDDLKLSKEERDERISSRLSNARKGARMGGKIGSVVPVAGTLVGTTLGAIGGFILGDQETVFPVDMVAIPAYQAFMIQGTPSFQIYIKEGEVLTQVIPTDAMEATEAVLSTPSKASKPKTTRKPSKYHVAYGKAFKELAPKYKLKSGKWAKNGFKRCASASRAQARKEMK